MDDTHPKWGEAAAPVVQQNGTEIVRYGQAWERLHKACSQLEPGAIEVLAYIAGRLVMGRKQYGDINVNDGRDWSEELRQEMADGAVYATCMILEKLGK